jgi:hypothetical protein
MQRDVIAKLKFARTVLLIVVAAFLITSMYATELTRLFVHHVAEPPMPLPRGVDIRYSDPLVDIIGRGTSTGKATAVTLGYTIVVRSQFDSLSLTERKRVISHELMHVQQRRKYWRFYLPLYGVLYVARGYSNHPLERGS